MSFAFETVSDKWHTEDGVAVREIHDMRVFEVSPVTFPAYPQTSIEMVDAARDKLRRARLTMARMAVR